MEANDDLPPVVQKALTARPGCSVQVAHASARKISFINGATSGTEEQRRSYYIACPASASSPPSRELVYVETRERTLPPGAGVIGGIFGEAGEARGGGVLGVLRDALRAARGEPPERKGPPSEGGGVRV